MKSIKRVSLCSACKVAKQEKWKLVEHVIEGAASCTRHGICTVCGKRRALVVMKKKDNKDIDISR